VSSCLVFVLKPLLSRSNLIGKHCLAIMDPGAVRELLCAAKQPFGQITQILLNDYFEHNRKHEAGWVAPAKRCSARVGRGRCRKHVSEAALCQFCWKHGHSWPRFYSKDEFYMSSVFLRRNLSGPAYQLSVDCTIEELQRND
jgi:hypothetical protein